MGAGEPLPAKACDAIAGVPIVNPETHKRDSFVRDLLKKDRGVHRRDLTIDIDDQARRRQSYAHFGVAIDLLVSAFPGVRGPITDRSCCRRPTRRPLRRRRARRRDSLDGRYRNQLAPRRLRDLVTRPA